MMTKYVALLRGINVGGHRRMKMDDLRQVLSTSGLEQVSTYIQSGNVRFESAEHNAETLMQRIEHTLHQWLGYEVIVVVRTVQELRDHVQANPFGLPRTDVEAKHLFVGFCRGEIDSAIELPRWSPKKDVEVIGVRGREVFSVHHIVNGKLSNFSLEKLLHTPITARNWLTVTTLAE